MLRLPHLLTRATIPRVKPASLTGASSSSLTSLLTIISNGSRRLTGILPHNIHCQSNES